MPITLPRQVTAATAAKRLPTAAELPYEDGEPMDTPWQYYQMTLLIASIEFHWLGRKDFFAGGNMFLYFSEERVFNKDFRGPDFFVVKGVDHDKKRLSWVSWEEGDRLPDVIIELISATSRTLDRTVKKQLYDERLETPEYFCFDPEGEKIEGWRRNGGGYSPIEPDENGRLWSKELEVSFDWRTGEFLQQQGRWVRMFDAHGKLVSTSEEAKAARIVAVEAENAKLRQQAARADIAEAENAKLRQQAARADIAEAENTKLRQELEALRQQSKPIL